jgi:predicted nucleic acid-binding protein
LIYVDANIVIRLLEGDSGTRSPLEAKLLPYRGTGLFLLTSQLTRLECRVQPLRANDGGLLALYDSFFASPEIKVLEISFEVIEKATELRASLNLKTPDALHLASGIIARASTFLTGDQQLARCHEIAVEIL